MKKFILISIIGIMASCISKPYNKVIIVHQNDSTKIVNYEFVDYIVDTISFEIDSTVPDSDLVTYYKYLQDSIKLEELRKDSLQYLNFKKITKIINGGYNGLEHRIQLWEKAKTILDSTYYEK